MTFTADIVELPPDVGGGHLAETPRLREFLFRADTWLPHEDQAIREVFASDSDWDTLAAKLGRTRRAVIHRAFLIGLRRNSQRRWSELEDAILFEHYYDAGAAGVQPLLPWRAQHSIHVRASRLGLRASAAANNASAPKPKLRGGDLEEAIRLREQERWSFERIGRHFGIAETSALNAVLIALCPRKGFTPAERDEKGNLSPLGKDRIRDALEQGLKGVEIMLGFGVSAACVAEQRRRYNAERATAGAFPLPPPGGGIAYSGVKLSDQKKTEVEALLMEGYGAGKITKRTGVSNTSVGRIRNRLIKRLRAEGKVLPGCDDRGVRRFYKDSAGAITADLKQALRAMLIERTPVRRAAEMLAIGTTSAYAIRNELAAELASRGEVLPKPILPGRVKAGGYPADPTWPPQGPAGIYRFRELLRSMSFDAAREAWSELQRATLGLTHRDSISPTGDDPASPQPSDQPAPSTRCAADAASPALNTGRRAA